MTAQPPSVPLRGLDALLTVDPRCLEITALLDRERAFGRMLELVPTAAGMEIAFVGSCSGSDALVITQMSTGTRTSALQGISVPKGLGLGGKTLALGEPQWVEDYPQASSISHHFDVPVAREGLRALIAAPILHDDRVIGVLYAAQRHPSPIGDRAIDAVQAAASQMAAAAIAAERAQSSAEVAVHEERRRLAIELHDGVGAVLFAIRAGMADLGGRLETDPLLRARVEALERQAQEASAMLRESLQALSASPKEMELAVTLRRDCLAFERDSSVPTKLVMVTDVPPLEQATVKALSSTVREALLNVRKHARARSVAVLVSSDGQGVTATVVDDGVGFSGAPADGQGIGLEVCAERLERVGGYLSVDDNEDGGVTLRAWVPA